MLSDETVAGNAFKFPTVAEFSGAIKTAEVRSADNRELYADTLYYEDCGNNACTPQYNGNISRMAHHLAHENNNYGEFRDVRYTYDELNRLTKVDDSKQDVFDEMFAYDAQGRITAQRRAGNVVNPTGGEYSYYSGKNRLKSVADNMGGTADERNMSDTANFVYDSEGNLVEDKSKRMKISYDWRGMPVEFRLEPTGSSSDTARLSMMYDGSGRRISKTFLTKSAAATSWDTVKVTHYTGIGTEIREEFHNGSRERVSVVVNMPQGLGRYKVADASQPADDNASRTFEWYLKNHLGSTMLVYGTVSSTDPNTADIGETKAAYDYRAFGEQVNLMPHDLDKVTENFTGKERDDETKLNYFGARYLDPMLGMWVSVDPKRQFASPYLYAGNGANPVNGVDGDGNVLLFAPGSSPKFKAEFARAIKYLNNGKSSAIIANLHKRKEVVYVREVSEAAGGEDGFIRKDEDLNAPTIDWDPYSALTFGDGLSQSPALGFLHEADHALGYLKDPDGFNARSLESDIEYDDQEEMRVIQGSETSAAKKLGEGVRHGHGGDSKIVDHSDER